MELSSRIGSPSNYDQLAPGDKTRRVSNSPPPSFPPGQFAQRGSERNVLRATKGFVRLVVRRYAKFRTPRDRPWCPPKETTAKEWRAAFKPGRAFQMYLRLLQKAPDLLHHPTSWATPAVKTISAGFTQSADLVSILRHIKIDTELG